ncbi:Endoribonuclease L-PSP/chorismate mutase-like protein [Lactarius psammicola]|nr:Endoribonuclease L-PSP/chorismate mutase-like protein [Lactarius psammicola]
MVKKIIFTEEALPPLPIFSQAVVSNGTVYASGNIGVNRESKLVGDVKEQTRAALQNLGKVLQASGSGLEHIVKINIYLTNLARDFGPMNETYAEFFEKGKFPARTYVEIECVAEVVEN